MKELTNFRCNEAKINLIGKHYHSVLFSFFTLNTLRHLAVMIPTLFTLLPTYLSQNLNNGAKL